MRWRDLRRSGNVEDRRGFPVGRGVVGGGLGAVVVALIAMFFGVDPGVVMQGGPGGGVPGAGAPPAGPAGAPPADDEAAQFVSAILGSTEEVWGGIFRQSGQPYQQPRLVLFSGAVQSACGFAQAAMGPFYCPPDQRVYIDLAFFQELRGRFHVPGDADFAQAYVIAHEVGHHVQQLTGVSEQVHAAQQRASREEANALSVRLELQADCYAGVWGFHTRQVLEPGDLEEAMAAASAIGDDRLQKESQGYVVPESFTHGSSAQRMHWFQRGMQAGDPQQCDTFSAGAL